MAGLYAQQMPPRAPVNYAMMTKTWQDAISNAAKQNGMAGSGTWTINDVVKAVRGTRVEGGGARGGWGARVGRGIVRR